MTNEPIDDGAVDRPDDSEFASARNRMVDRLVSSGHITRDETASAMRAVPRHEFVPSHQRGEAYADRPLGIGEGQTISAPHMVAMMTDLLALQADHRVLEIGTGCGYHAAVTAEIVGAENVYSVEYHETLGEQAKAALERTGYGAVTVTIGDGNAGWPTHAPYDRAYLTCAPEQIPDSVIEQVTDGFIVAPEGRTRQELVRLSRSAGETVERETHGAVRFVRMRGG